VCVNGGRREYLLYADWFFSKLLYVARIIDGQVMLPKTLLYTNTSYNNKWMEYYIKAVSISRNVCSWETCGLKNILLACKKVWYWSLLEPGSARKNGVRDWGERIAATIKICLDWMDSSLKFSITIWTYLPLNETTTTIRLRWPCPYVYAC